MSSISYTPYRPYLYRFVTALYETKIIRSSKFGKICFFTEFKKWHSHSKFEEQNSAVGSNIRRHSLTSSCMEELKAWEAEAQDP